MNSNLIPLGPTEVINVTGGTIPTAGSGRQILMIEALGGTFVATAVTFIHSAAPPHVSATGAFTLNAGQHLFHVKSITGTGTVSVIYKNNP